MLVFYATSTVFLTPHGGRFLMEPAAVFHLPEALVTKLRNNLRLGRKSSSSAPEGVGLEPGVKRRTPAASAAQPPEDVRPGKFAPAGATGVMQSLLERAACADL